MWPSKSGSDLPGRGVWPDMNDVGAQLGHGRRHALIPSRFLRLLRGIGLLDTCHLGALDNDRGVEDGMQEVRDGGRHHGLRCIRHPTTSPEEIGMASAKVIGGTTTTSSSLVPCPVYPPRASRAASMPRWMASWRHRATRASEPRPRPTSPRRTSPPW